MRRIGRIQAVVATPEEGGCDDQSKAAFGSVWAGGIAVARSPAKRVSRPNAAAQRKVTLVPELSIVEHAVWDAVQLCLGRIREASGADKPDRSRFRERRRARNLLTVKLYYGCCGGAVSAVGKDLLACTAARRQGSCDNRQGIRRPVLDGLILEGLRTQLMQPEHVALFVAEFTTEWNRLQADLSGQRASQQRELETVRRKLSGLIDAIADGLRSPGLQQKLDELTARQTDLERHIRTAPLPAPALHPNLATVYRDKVAHLHAALRTASDDIAALEVVRSLIERVVLHPASDGCGPGDRTDRRDRRHVSAAARIRA